MHLAVEGPPPGASLDVLTLIRELEGSASGLAYVYRSLDQLVAGFGLDDAMLVTDHPGLGRQIFRPRGQARSCPHPVEWSAAPGLYPIPDVVPATVKEAVAALCQVALSIDLARHDAAHDALTGLLNRRSFDDVLTAFLANSMRHGTPFSLALIDVDGLKHVNDTWGHWEGDRVLQTTGAELRRTLRGADVAARLGGDEFGLLLVSAVREATVHLRDRVVQAVGARLGRETSFSVGVATCPDDSSDAVGLYRLADSRLYEDKRRRPPRHGRPGE